MDRGRGRGRGLGRGGRNPQTNFSPPGASSGAGQTPPNRNPGPRGCSSGSKNKFVYVPKNQAKPSSFEPKTGTSEQVKSLIHPDMPPQENNPPLYSPPSYSASSHKGPQTAQSTTNVTDGSVKSNELNVSCQGLDISPVSINGDKVGSSPLKDPKPPSSDRKPVNSEPSSVSDAFDICPRKATSLKLQPSLLVRNRERRDEKKRSLESESESEVLRPGMVLLKNYISLDEQVKIVKRCHRLGLGPGGFYQPGYRDGAKLHLNMMCLGQNWDPESSQYGDTRPTDGAKAPPIPEEFYQLVEKAIKDSHALICKKEKATNAEGILPRMRPDICLVNFYSTNGRLGLHQDRDESPQSIKKGLPVVSFSIGDSAEFLYGDERDVDRAKKVTLKSGDVLVFGGKSRQVFHGVACIEKDTAPKTLLEETNLRQGRLNLTFRQY